MSTAVLASIHGPAISPTKLPAFHLSARSRRVRRFRFRRSTHVQNIERYNLTTGSGDDALWLSGSGNVIATNSGDDTVSFDHVTGSNVFAAGDGEDHLTVNCSDQTQNLSTFNVAGNNFAGAVGVNSWNGSDFGNGAGVRFDNVDTFTLLGGSGDDTLIGRSGDDLRRSQQRCSRRGLRQRHRVRWRR